MFRVRFPLVLRVTPRRRTVSSSGERYDTLLIIQQYKNESVSLDKYIYIYIYIYIYTHVYTHIYIYIYTYKLFFPERVCSPSRPVVSNR